MKIFCAIFLSVILFSGCTTKSVFKTEITEDTQVMANTVMSASEKQG